jgi:hypothetical protein
MHIEVRDHAAIHKFLFTKSRASATPCSCDHLARNRELHLAGKLRVLALLAGLDLVPQGFAIVQTLRCAFRQHHSEWTTPALFEKSWSRPSRSSCSRSPRDRQRSQPRSIPSRG